MNGVDEYALKYWGNTLRKNENNVYLPNDIFLKLKNSKFKNGKHKLIAIVYYYIISWVYRYAKADDIYTRDKNYSSVIKEMCGLNRNEKRVDYIFKGGGVLDKIKLTESLHISEAPYLSHYDEYTNYVTFDYLKELIELGDGKKLPSRIMIKKPLMGVNKRVVDGVTYLGTFQDIEYTFNICMRDFIYLIYILKLDTEVVGFYLYLMSLSSYYGGSIKRSRIAMAEELNLSEKTVTRYKNILKKHGIIREYYNNPSETKEINTIIMKASDLYATTKTTSD